MGTLLSAAGGWALLLAVGLFTLWVVKRTQKQPTTTDAPTTPQSTTTETRPPTTHVHGSHDSHAPKSEWRLLKFAIGLLAVVLVLALAVLISKGMGFGEAPSLRINSSFVASPRARPAQTTWTTNSAPSEGWLVLSVLPGYTLSHCDLATSLAACEAADPVGYRAKCTDEEGQEHLWPEPCTKTTYMSFQSKTSTPAPIHWKDNTP